MVPIFKILKKEGQVRVTAGLSNGHAAQEKINEREFDICRYHLNFERGQW